MREQESRFAFLELGRGPLPVTANTSKLVQGTPS